jgi:predicted  nucleic acid-binding Zn-ribbon protein
VPSVSSNSELARCRNCGSVYSFADKAMAPPCPRCGVVHYEWIIVQPVCDFCSDPLPLDGECWTFPCESFEYPFMLVEFGADGANAQTEGSADDWAACDTCYELIEKGDRIGLAKRSVEKDLERHPNAANERHMLMAMTRAMQDGFMEHRTGPPFRERVADHQKGGE